MGSLITERPSSLALALDPAPLKRLTVQRSDDESVRRRNWNCCRCQVREYWDIMDIWGHRKDRLFKPQPKEAMGTEGLSRYKDCKKVNVEEEDFVSGETSSGEVTQTDLIMITVLMP